MKEKRDNHWTVDVSTIRSGELVESQDVVMAGTSRRPRSELEPDDLSSPTAPKKLRSSGKDEDESEDEGEGEGETEGSKAKEESVERQTAHVTTEDKISSCDPENRSDAVERRSSVEWASRQGPEIAGGESLSLSAELAAGCSRGGQFGGFVSIAREMRSVGRPGQEGVSERPGTSGKRGAETAAAAEPATGASSHSQSSLLGEHALYQELSLIGNGAYGTVYKAKDLNSGQVVALKKVRVPLTEDGLPTSTLREIATLKQLERFEHPHIVRLLDVCQGNYLHLPSDDGRSERVDRGLTLWLVFEHVERDLASYISSSPRTGIPPQLVRQMSKEILRGVEFLHSHRIIHRDLKPQNLLVSREGRVKIADFGLAKTYDFEMRLTSVVVTQWYRAPEVLLGCSYATPVDLWSVGCILAELNKLEPLFPGTSEGDQLDRIFQIIGTPSQEEWPEYVSLSWTAFPQRQPKPLRAIIPDLSEEGLDLIKRLLTFDPHSRLTASQALRHLYFAEGDS